MIKSNEHEARTQALIHLSKAHREAIQNRFKTEWWVIVSIVTLSLYVYLNLDNKVISDIKPLILFALAVLDVLGIITLYHLHTSNQINRKIFITSEKELAEINLLYKTKRSLCEINDTRNNNRFHQIFTVQVFIIVILFFVNAAFLYLNSTNPNKGETETKKVELQSKQDVCSAVAVSTCTNKTKNTENKEPSPL